MNYNELHYKELKEAIKLFIKLIGGTVQIGTYIDFDNYVVKFLDYEGNVVKFIPIEEKEYNLLKTLYEVE